MDRAIHNWRALSRFERIALLAIPILVLLHYFILTVSPPGFYIDEEATQAHVVHMLQDGQNANGESLPLFSRSLGGGYTTPTYLYPLTVWSALFGTSPYSLRAFSLTVTITTIFILGVVLYQWYKQKHVFLITILVGLTLPWAWLQGSLAWDPILVPFFVSIALLGFSIAYKNSKHNLAWLLVLTISLVLLAYTYPPCRVSAPLLLAFLLIVLWKKDALTFRNLAILILIGAVISLPLLHFMLQPEALERSTSLSVFHGNSAAKGFLLFDINIALLFSPVFLFITGDSNLRHATGVQGMLGLAALPAVIYWFTGFVRRLKRQTKHTSDSFIVTSTIGIAVVITGYIGSALTGEGQPHFLRACAAWPGFVLLISLGWIEILRKKRLVALSLIIFALIAVALYCIDLAFLYPTRSASSF